MTQHSFRPSGLLRTALLGASCLLLAAAPGIGPGDAAAQDQQQSPQNGSQQQNPPQENPPVKNNDASGGLQAGGAVPGSPGSAAASPTTEPQATEPTAPPAARPLTPQAYAETAAITDMFEIEASKLALTKSNNKDVKTFARHMIQDHEESAIKLNGVVKDKQVSVALPTSLDQQHQDMLTKLQNVEGQAFDELYVKMQLKGHREAVKLHQNYADNGDTAELKTFAVTTAPIVEKHLERIEQIAKMLNISA